MKTTTYKGAVIIRANYRGHVIERAYMGYTRREAVAMFREYMREEAGK